MKLKSDKTLKTTIAKILNDLEEGERYTRKKSTSHVITGCLVPYKGNPVARIFISQRR